MRKLKLLLLIVWLFSPFFLIAQQGFLKLFDNSPEDSAVFLDILNDNDTLVFYALTYDSNNVQGIGFYQIDTFGNVLNKNIIIDTSRTLTTSSEYRKKIIKTNDQHYAILGNSSDHTFFLKVNKDLEQVSLVTYDSDTYIANASLIQMDDGFFVLITKTTPLNSFAYNVLLIRTDQNGQELWRKEYGTNEFAEAPIGITKANDNEYIISGVFLGYPDWDAPFWPQTEWESSYLLAVDTFGNQLWEWHSDTTEARGALTNLLILEDSSLLCIGTTWEFNAQYGEYQTHPLIMRLDKNHNIIWEKLFGTLGPLHSFLDLEPTPDGHFLASGYANLEDYETYPRGIHHKFDIDGHRIWQRRDSIYPNSWTVIRGSEILSSGSIISIGYSSGGPYGATGILIKLTPDGCIDTLNCFPMVGITPTKQPENIHIYPNPTLDELRLEFKGSLRKRIKIYDSLGRIVKDFRSETEPTNIDVHNLVPGLYHIEVLTLKGRYTEQFIKS